MILKGVQNRDIDQSEWEDIGRQGEEPVSLSKMEKMVFRKKVVSFPPHFQMLFSNVWKQDNFSRENHSNR